MVTMLNLWNIIFCIFRSSWVNFVILLIKKFFNCDTLFIREKDVPRPTEEATGICWAQFALNASWTTVGFHVEIISNMSWHWSGRYIHFSWHIIFYYRRGFLRTVLIGWIGRPLLFLLSTATFGRNDWYWSLRFFHTYVCKAMTAIRFSLTPRFIIN